MSQRLYIPFFLKKKCLLFIWLCQALVSGIQFPQLGMEPSPLPWEHGVLAAGPQGSPDSAFLTKLPGGATCCLSADLTGIRKLCIFKARGVCVAACGGGGAGCWPPVTLCPCCPWSLLWAHTAHFVNLTSLIFFAPGGPMLAHWCLYFTDGGRGALGKCDRPKVTWCTSPNNEPEIVATRLRAPRPSLP